MLLPHVLGKSHAEDGVGLVADLSFSYSPK